MSERTEQLGEEELKARANRAFRLALSVFVLPWATIVVGEMSGCLYYIYLLMIMWLLPVFSIIYSGIALFGHEADMRNPRSNLKLGCSFSISLAGGFFWVLLVANI